MTEVVARLGSNGEKLLCGRVRLPKTPCSPELGTYFGRDGGDPESFRVELALHLIPVPEFPGATRLFAFSPSRQNARDQGHSVERSRATRHPEGFQFVRGSLSEHNQLKRWEVKFPADPAVLVRCPVCQAENTVEGVRLAEQYQSLVAKGALRRHR